ncbi:alcohol dehydrogenase catalytic domain-containing protein [Actinoplanes sp. M2I2]|uniref:alcohol dehydrogenase catalytic domain-containing protein n=1 Tax=Actinoplanes sp. M2I2 TaxID=1734444 RepID=UPI0020219B36|nr:alcohol dehydrogenase catalytic domain-containing protein [Actinoplanes sp. M2I2]
MKAVRFSRFGGPEVLEIVELPDPHPGPGEVRIAVRAAGVSVSDGKKRQGLMDQELPQTMGYEAAGVVDELGEGVTGVAVGDRVFGFCADGAAQAERAVLAHYAPIPYGDGLVERVRALAPGGVDLALDVAGSGVLPELVALAGGPERVLTVADFPGAQKHGVRFSRGDSGRALHALTEIGPLIESGRFALPAVRTFLLAEVAAAHRAVDENRVRAKLVLVVG